ncbi:MAG: hypothetical protein JO197_08195 [Acidobacteria bacterium]|nr:hypothetical protein [Acidobacteriota bacterium]
MIFVSILGGSIALISAAILFFTFRSFSGKKPPFILMIAVLGFVFAACTVLLALSFAGQH